MHLKDSLETLKIVEILAETFKGIERLPETPVTASLSVRDSHRLLDLFLDSLRDSERLKKLAEKPRNS